MKRLLRDMNDAEIDAYAAMRVLAVRVRARHLLEGASLASVGVVLAVIMFTRTNIHGAALASGLIAAVIALVAGVFRMVSQVGPNRFESMQRSKAAMRLKPPQVEELDFRVRRAWSVQPVDEDSDAFLLDVDNNQWIYTNGCVHPTSGPHQSPAIPSVWRVTRWPDGGPVEAITEPPEITVEDLDLHPESLPEAVLDADWTLVLLSFDQLPTEWQSSIRSSSSS